MKQLTYILIFSFFAAQSALAQSDTSIKRGEQVAMQLCASCHGQAGVSQLGTQPNLAGQVAGYIFKQLQHYRSGARPGAIMLTIAQSIDEQQMRDVDHYYASLKPSFGNAASADKERIEKAKNIYRWGDQARGIPACAACHGPAGAGIPSIFPMLSGQHPEYSLARLKQYQNDTDHYNSFMSPITQKLSEKELLDLSWYLRGLRP